MMKKTLLFIVLLSFVFSFAAFADNDRFFTLQISPIHGGLCGGPSYTLISNNKINIETALYFITLSKGSGAYTDDYFIIKPAIEAYYKLNFPKNKKILPFVGGGIGFAIAFNTVKLAGTEVDTKHTYLEPILITFGGVRYLINEKLAFYSRAHILTTTGDKIFSYRFGLGGDVGVSFVLK